MGAGFSASGAGALGAAGLFGGPIGWGLAAGGFALSAFQGMSQNAAISRRNKGIAASANSQMAAVNQNIINSRINYYDSQNIASGQARDAQAQQWNGAGFVSGGSINQYIAQKMADTAVDSYARSRQQASVETAAAQQKQSIANQAMSSMTSGSMPLLGAIQGGLQGLQMGTQLAGSLQNYNIASSRNDALNMLTGKLQDFGNFVGPMDSGTQDAYRQTMSQASAIAAGGNPDMILGPNGNLFTQSYMNQYAQQDASWNALQRQNDVSAHMLTMLQDQQGYTNSVYRLYNPAGATVDPMRSSILPGVWSFPSW